MFKETAFFKINTDIQEQHYKSLANYQGNNRKRKVLPTQIYYKIRGR